jgi:hypothetical protein
MTRALTSLASTLAAIPDSTRYLLAHPGDTELPATVIQDRLCAASPSPPAPRPRDGTRAAEQYPHGGHSRPVRVISRLAKSSV